MIAVLVTVVVVLLIVGLILYLMNLAPIDARIKQAITAIVIVFCIIWLLYMLMPGLLVRSWR